MPLAPSEVRGATGLPSDLRRQMIDQTSRFVSWALRNPGAVPVIPRRRVDEGGFGRLLGQPGARALVGRWWSRTLGRDWPPV